MKGRAIRYTPEELAFVRSRRALNRRALHAAFVHQFGRVDVTVEHIRNLCTRNGWGRVERWRPEEDAVLRELYADTKTERIAKQLGRPLDSVYRHARALGLEKSEAYLASPDACRLRRGNHMGAAHRFSKGHVPANKGLRRPGFAPGRMKDTQFVGGQAGWNWKPIGAERVVAGYRYTKVSDRRRAPWTVNWRPTHILLWEQLHGPIPAKHALKAIDGNRLNVEPSNWELISRAVLLRLNRKGRDYDAAPAELKPTLMALAKLEHAKANARNRRSA